MLSGALIAICIAFIIHNVAHMVVEIAKGGILIPLLRVIPLAMLIGAIILEINKLT